MATKYTNTLFLAVTFSLFSAAAAQDTPSLGDLARQQRQQEQANPPKVYTNADLPEHSAPSPPPAASSEEHAPAMPATSAGPNQPHERMRAQIEARRSQLATIQARIDQMRESSRSAPNCARGCVGWNQRQQERQEQIQRMQARVDEEKRRLDEMEARARQPGRGGSPFDPIR